MAKDLTAALTMAQVAEIIRNFFRMHLMPAATFCFLTRRINSGIVPMKSLVNSGSTAAWP